MIEKDDSLTVTANDIAGQVTTAISRFQAGRLDEASSLCQAVLAKAPGHFDALHLLGVIELRSRHFDTGLSYLDRAIAIQPENAEVRNNWRIAVGQFNRARMASAVALHQQGRFLDAEVIYQSVLELEPFHFDATQLLGALAGQRGQHQLALIFLERALSINPNNAEAHNNRGIALRHLQRVHEALESYDHALRINPDYAEANCNRGNALQQLSRMEEALASYNAALAIKPEYAEALCNCGNVLQSMKRPAEAVDCYDRALMLTGDLADALYNRGNALHTLNRQKDALESYERALAVNPDYAEAYCNRGNILQALGRWTDALSSYDRALELKPDYANAHNNRGNVLLELKQVSGAMTSYEKALSYAPEYASAHNNRGNAFFEMDRITDALHSYEQALTLNPAYAKAHYNRGKTLLELGRLDDAIAAYENALAIDPEYIDAHWNQGLCLLLKGDYEAGWRKFEWRWRLKGRDEQPRNYVQPLWNPSVEQCGKTILLYGEQGLGDTLQFSRYVEQVARLGANVLLEVPRTLMPVFRNFKGVTRLVAKGAKPPAFDYYCPLMSLPRVFNTRLDEISGLPYLQVPENRLKAWQSRLALPETARIGVVWSGNAGHKNDRDRSIPLAIFKHLLVGEYAYFSLQKEIRELDKAELPALPMLRTFTAELADFSDTAALISLMDVVITVDTSVAHLAGALGKEVWILLPFVPDWRWMMHRPDSPWYDSATLIRQSKRADWPSVVGEVAERLRKRFVR